MLTASAVTDEIVGLLALFLGFREMRQVNLERARQNLAYTEIYSPIDGTVISRPFVELDEELWSDDGLRLTLIFDPGRVKAHIANGDAVQPQVRVRIIDGNLPDVSLPRDLLIPVTGDLSGPRAVAAIGTLIAARGETETPPMSKIQPPCSLADQVAPSVVESLTTVGMTVRRLMSR